MRRTVQTSDRGEVARRALSRTPATSPAAFPGNVAARHQHLGQRLLPKGDAASQLPNRKRAPRLAGPANVVTGACEKIGKDTDSLTVAARNETRRYRAATVRESVIWIYSHVPGSNFRAGKYPNPEIISSRNFVPVTILAGVRLVPESAGPPPQILPAESASLAPGKPLFQNQRKTQVAPTR